jgi:ATPase subunit of ABC transporter with duplicated ATPase domains
MSYKGNYDVFVKTAAERLRNAQKAAEAQAAKKAHVQVCMIMLLGFGV